MGDPGAPASHARDPLNWSLLALGLTVGALVFLGDGTPPASAQPPPCERGPNPPPGMNCGRPRDGDEKGEKDGEGKREVEFPRGPRERLPSPRERRGGGLAQFIATVESIARPATAAVGALAGVGVLVGAALLAIGQTTGPKIIGLSVGALLAIPLGTGLIELIKP